MAAIMLPLPLARVAFTSYRRLESSKQALQDSEFRWKFALEGAGDAMFDRDIGSRVALFSLQCKHMLGFAEGEMDNTFDAWSEPRAPPAPIRGCTGAPPWCWATSTPPSGRDARS